MIAVKLCCGKLYEQECTLITYPINRVNVHECRFKSLLIPKVNPPYFSGRF